MGVMEIVVIVAVVLFIWHALRVKKNKSRKDAGDCWTGLRFQVHPQQQVSEARVVAEGTPVIVKEGPQ